MVDYYWARKVISPNLKRILTEVFRIRLVIEGQIILIIILMKHRSRIYYNPLITLSLISSKREAIRRIIKLWSLQKLLRW